MALRAVVFDFDGVIVNSEPLHYRALHDAQLVGGYRAALAEARHVQTGAGGDRSQKKVERCRLWAVLVGDHRVPVPRRR